jgi:hypothetical protein
VWDDEEKRGHRAAREDRTGYAPKTFARPSYAAASQKPIDPFFTQPYQEPIPELLASHTDSQSNIHAASTRAGLSPNIKSKKKVAALFS